MALYARAISRFCPEIVGLERSRCGLLWRSAVRVEQIHSLQILFIGHDGGVQYDLIEHLPEGSSGPLCKAVLPRVLAVREMGQDTLFAEAVCELFSRELWPLVYHEQLHKAERLNPDLDQEHSCG